MKDLQCPVSFDKVNNSLARIVAALVIIVSVIALVTNLWWLLLFQAYDFFVRAIDAREYSIYRRIAIPISSALNLPEILVDAAPKRFAAGIGVLFSISIALLLFFDLFIPAVVTSVLLLVCAFFELTISFCVGCYVYTYFVSPFLKAKSSN
jgi:hypothetical protein